MNAPPWITLEWVAKLDRLLSESETSDEALSAAKEMARIALLRLSTEASIKALRAEAER